MHWLKKLGRTVCILSCLFMARMFGRYEYSGFDGEIEYCRYRWRGRSWVIPTGSVED